jgi:hypothetical protein
VRHPTFAALGSIAGKLGRDGGSIAGETP